MSRDNRYTTELDNTDVLRRMQQVRANPNPGGPEGGGPFIYAIYVFDIQEGRAVRQFGFDVPPTTIRLSGDFAEDYTAGQEGGFWMDGQGMYVQQLEISGNFGYRPTPVRNRGVQQQIPFANQVRRSVDQLVGAGGRLANSVQAGLATFPEGEVTGNDRFRLLKNIFYFYADRKKYRETASRTVLVWANFRTGEVYLCQPSRWGDERSAPSGRHKSNYSFGLKLVAPLRMEVPKDFLLSPRAAQGRQGGSPGLPGNSCCR